MRPKKKFVTSVHKYAKGERHFLDLLDLHFVPRQSILIKIAEWHTEAMRHLHPNPFDGDGHRHQTLHLSESMMIIYISNIITVKHH